MRAGVSSEELVPTDDRPTIDGFVSWTPVERESFFATIARHRRAAWRVTVASTLTMAIMALVVAALMSPLFYSTLALGFDLANLFHPMPDGVPAVLSGLDLATDHPDQVPAGLWARWVVLAALPGLLFMSVVILMLSRVLRIAASSEVGALRTHVANSAVLAEQRFTNVIGEMALAAALPLPRVLIADWPVVNAAVLGPDVSRATIVVSARLLARLTRDQMQGVAADLMASIANGDLPIGMRAALAQSLFHFIQRISDLASKRGGWSRLASMALSLVYPRGAAAQRIAAEIRDPFAATDTVELTRGSSGSVGRRSGSPPKAPNSDGDSSDHARPNWREWLAVPLYGPLYVTGFLSGMMAQYFLGPMLALVWRQRKYMADATAVRLTRDPDALAGALQRIGDGAVLAPSLGHLSVVSAGYESAALGSPFVSMFPPLRKRLESLVRMGALVDLSATGHWKPPRKLVILMAMLGPVAALLGLVATVLLVGMSVVFTMLFTGAPFMVIHTLLRLIGH